MKEKNLSMFYIRNYKIDNIYRESLINDLYKYRYHFSVLDMNNDNYDDSVRFCANNINDLKNKLRKILDYFEF